MMAILKTIFYVPLYNGLVFLMDILPFADAGISLVLFTIIVKLALFPLSQKAIKEQLRMKETNEELNKVKEKHKGNREQQARAVLAFYKEKKINPFSGVLVMFIQLPIIIALYSIFLNGGLPKISSELLYPFVSIPDAVSMSFLGFIDITKKNIILALIAAALQYFQSALATPPAPAPSKTGGVPNMAESFAKSMQFQMKYIFPAMIFFSAYAYSGVVALYLITSSAFAVGQELYVRRSNRLRLAGEAVIAKITPPSLKDGVK